MSKIGDEITVNGQKAVITDVKPLRFVEKMALKGIGDRVISAQIEAQKDQDQIRRKVARSRGLDPDRALFHGKSGDQVARRIIQYEFVKPGAPSPAPPAPAATTPAPAAAPTNSAAAATPATPETAPAAPPAPAATTPAPSAVP